MATPKVELTCVVCATSFSRGAAEMKRNERLGRPTYCSRACAGRANYKNIPLTSMTWSHLAGISRSDMYSPFRTCHRIARKRAKDYEKEFTLTLEDLRQLWEKQQGVCPYTGLKMILPTTSTEYNLFAKDRSPRSASLDRIDSKRGYTLDNVQFVCFMAKSLSSCEVFKPYYSAWQELRKKFIPAT